MDIFVILMVFTLLFGGGYNLGRNNGIGESAEETRNKVVLYCIEKPQLCKEEYNNIKTQSKLNQYQRPEIK
jgi:hypothetical protein